MSLGDAHWDADIDRLADSIGLPKPRARWPLARGAAVLAAALVGGWAGLRPARPPPPPPPPDASERLRRRVAAPRCAMTGATAITERFEFKRHAGELTGTASFLAYPRAIEKLRVDGMNLHFETRSTSSMNNDRRAR